MKHYDVVVIGGGHAGVEAAAAAARLGAKTALITMKVDAIGVMSCNPAMGGLGKGHLIREIDALDGLMGQIADRAGIQFRLLNRSRGPAVQGPRAQIDRMLYRSGMQAQIARTKNLDVIEGEIVAFVLVNGRVTAVDLASGERLGCSSAVLTAGTFLRGKVHIGNKSQDGGRIGAQSSLRLADQLRELALPQGRLKTGTPPRLDGRSIDWARVGMQAGDQEPEMLSFMSTKPMVPQVQCGITHTNEHTHDIVRQNIDLSAMYGGHIDGVGPRYCPSIEDKVTRFADKVSHQVYLEPEGLMDHTIYPNGISTSLPEAVQERYVRTIIGLEKVEILQPGYAIEYDFFDPRCLDSSLAVRDMPGLYFAGQINGTTGYEEAAAQGVVAGLASAAASLGREAATFSRTNSYIGVMVDDLTTRGVTEPYRMFTSRAEFRLTLRADNADKRLTPLGRRIGCVDDRRWSMYQRKQEGIDILTTLMMSRTYTPTELAGQGARVSQDGQRRTVYALIGQPDVGIGRLDDLAPEAALFDREVRRQVVTNALYAQYTGRQDDEIASLKRDEGRAIPAHFDYAAVPGLSRELCQKLSMIRPANLAQAARIEGITPAALVLLLANIRQIDRRVQKA